MFNPRNAGRKRKLTPLEEANVVSQSKSGKHIYEIAWEHRVSESTVFRALRRAKCYTQNKL